MAGIGQKIKELMGQKNIDAPALAKRLGKTKQAVYAMLEKDDVSTSVLRDVAKALDVPVIIFFTDGEQNNANAGDGGVAFVGNNNGSVTLGDCSALQNRIDLLEKLLEERERVIAEKERLIGVLMKQQ